MSEGTRIELWRCPECGNISLAEGACPRRNGAAWCKDADGHYPKMEPLPVIPVQELAAELREKADDPPDNFSKAAVVAYRYALSDVLDYIGEEECAEEAAK